MNKNHQINQYYYNGSFFLNDVLWPGAIFLIALTLSSYMFKSFTLHVLLKFVFSIYFFTRLKNISRKEMGLFQRKGDSKANCLGASFDGDYAECTMDTLYSRVDP